MIEGSVGTVNYEVRTRSQNDLNELVLVVHVGPSNFNSQKDIPVAYSRVPKYEALSKVVQEHNCRCS